MTFIAIGLNHKTAPVQIREKFSFAPDKLMHALLDCKAQPGIQEVAILSTCNRTEIYCYKESDEHATLIEWLQSSQGLVQENIVPYLYIYKAQQAVAHMLRVASGLDSMVLGEPQILGQMKTAFNQAKQAGTIGRMLHKLFEQTFNCAKQVRTDTAIGASPVSVAFASVTLAKRLFADFSQHSALLIGAGETIELVALHLKEVGIRQIIIANRTYEKAHKLAKSVDGYAIELEEISNHLPEADIVISSTASPQPLVTKNMVEKVVHIRKHRPIFMVDIAVPRDIEASVGTLEDIYLYTVDDLQDIIEEGLKSRQEAAEMAEDIIETQTMHFMNWLKSLHAVKTLCCFRGQAEKMRDQAVQNALRQLDTGRPAKEVVQELAHQLTNKILHQPSIQIKQASMDNREDVVQAACILFNIES